MEYSSDSQKSLQQYLHTVRAAPTASHWQQYGPTVADVKQKTDRGVT